MNSFDQRLRTKKIQSITIDVQLIISEDLTSEYAMQWISKKIKKSDFKENSIFQIYLNTHWGNISSLLKRENVVLNVNGEKIIPIKWDIEIHY